MARLTLPPIKFFCVSKPKHDKNSFDLKKHLMWWEPGFGWGKRSESIFIIPVTVGANRKLYVSSFDHAADIFYFHLASAFTPKGRAILFTLRLHRWVIFVQFLFGSTFLCTSVQSLKFQIKVCSIFTKRLLNTFLLLEFKMFNPSLIKLYNLSDIY